MFHHGVAKCLSCRKGRRDMPKDDNKPDSTENEDTIPCGCPLKDAVVETWMASGCMAMASQGSVGVSRPFHTCSSVLPCISFHPMFVGPFFVIHEVLYLMDPTIDLHAFYSSSTAAYDNKPPQSATFFSVAAIHGHCPSS